MTVFRSLLIRYQNYLLEFYQLIEDKNLISTKDHQQAQQIKNYLENLPEFSDSFEIGFSLSKISGDMQTTWTVHINDSGFSVRSFTLDDLEELEQWYFHYHDTTQEFEGNLFADGDWDLFLEEIAEVDDDNGVTLKAEFIYQ